MDNNVGIQVDKRHLLEQKCVNTLCPYVCSKSRVKAFSKLKTGPRLSLCNFGEGVVLDTLGASRP